MGAIRYEHVRTGQSGHRSRLRRDRRRLHPRAARGPAHRSPDPRRPRGRRAILNVGAGAGAYEPSDLEVTAVEPSTVMRAQRPPGAAPGVDASAEVLPFPDGSFDAAMPSSPTTIGATRPAASPKCARSPGPGCSSPGKATRRSTPRSSATTSRRGRPRAVRASDRGSGLSARTGRSSPSPGGFRGVSSCKLVAFSTSPMDYVLRSRTLLD
jgi:hypothetical protein